MAGGTERTYEAGPPAELSAEPAGGIAGLMRLFIEASAAPG